MIKNNYHANATLIRCQLYLQSQAWKEDEVKIVPLGWILGSLPDGMDNDRYTKYS